MASLLQPVRAVWDFFDFLRQPAVPFVDPALKDKIDSSLLENCKPHHREVVQMVLTDMYGRRKEAIIRLPARMEAYIRDHMLTDDRELLTALTFLQVTVWAVFSAVVQLLLIPREWSYYWVLPHLAVTWGLLAQRFILAMHYAAHRPIFSTKKCGAVATVLNAIPQTLLSNYYGLPAGAYYLHHCVMHHQANNFFPYDISSTMPYDRSNPLHFVIYVLNFMLHTFFYLPFYAVQKRRYQLAAAFAGTFCVYSYVFRALYNWHPAFFLAQFGVSFAIGPIALMLGNYSQHIFVDPASPESNYSLACNHIAAPFNMTTFNDGYHITHHVTSITHWSEMPIHFVKNLDKYEAGGAIIFKEICFDDIFFMVITGEWGLRRLAKKYYVHLTPEHKTESEIVAMFRERLKPIKGETIGAPQKAIFLTNQAFWFAAYLWGFPFAGCVTFLVPVFHVLYLLM